MADPIRCRRPIITCLIAAALTACAAPQAKENYEALMDRGRQLEQREDNQNAAQALEQARAIRPRDASPNRELGLIYDKLDQFEKASQAFIRALKAGPDDYVLRVSLANDYVKLGRLKEAREQFARARKLDDKEADAYIQEGYANLSAGNLKEAKKDFSDLLAVNPTSGLSYHHWASYLNRSGDHAGAEKSLRKALELFQADPHAELPNILHSTWNLGMLLRDEGRLDEAQAIFAQGLSESKTLPFYQARFLAKLAEIDQRQGKLAQAETSWKEAWARCEGPGACDLSDSTEVLYSTAKFYAAQGRRAEAEQALDQAWRLFQATGRISPVQNLADIGDAYLRVGADAKAETVYRFLISFRDSIRGVPALAQAEANLAGICARAGRKAEAAELYRDAITVADLAGARDLKQDFARKLDALAASR